MFKAFGWKCTSEFCVPLIVFLVASIIWAPQLKFCSDVPAQVLKSNSAHTNNYSSGSLGHPAVQGSTIYSKKGHLHGFFFNSHSMMTFNKSSYAHCSQVNQFWLGALPSPFSVCARIPNGRSNFVIIHFICANRELLLCPWVYFWWKGALQTRSLWWKQVFLVPTFSQEKPALITRLFSKQVVHKSEDFCTYVIETLSQTFHLYSILNM